ncbi:metallophosphoesterase [Acidocella sp. C78]|uniref:metallophosphoesterase family protein n=1 Tax=Acidocella sp. C78 TaxID=1671486 RepID=UPI0020BDAC54|nr:metallophosphoesterase family protein [Acidocella sp. C78]
MLDMTTGEASIPVIAAEGPVLVFGGCYSNLQATRALLDAARAHGIPPERMICTGDVVAYGADPQACADLIRGHGIATVMGNCEEQLGAGRPIAAAALPKARLATGWPPPGSPMPMRGSTMRRGAGWPPCPGGSTS